MEYYQPILYVHSNTKGYSFTQWNSLQAKVTTEHVAFTYMPKQLSLIILRVIIKFTFKGQPRVKTCYCKHCKR